MIRNVSKESRGIREGKGGKSKIDFRDKKIIIERKTSEIFLEIF